jgi:uncharacterized membrane protein
MFQEEIEALDEYDFCSVCFGIVRKCDFFVCLFFLLPRLIVWHQVQKTKNKQSQTVKIIEYILKIQEKL